MTDLEAAANCDLENLRKWLIANGRILNDFMLVSLKPMIKNISGSPNVLIGNKQTKQVNECKTLGATIDLHLSWKSNAVKKVTAGICYLSHQTIC